MVSVPLIMRKPLVNFFSKDKKVAVFSNKETERLSRGSRWKGDKWENSVATALQFATSFLSPFEADWIESICFFTRIECLTTS